MAIWDITVSAGSGVGSGTDVLLTTISGVVPGDFDNATINSVVVQSSPTITSDGTTDDTIGIRFFITTTTPADTFGGDGSDAASMCHASLGNGASSATITDGSSRSPNPGTAVAADWDEVRYSINYTASMKNDGETMSWSSFTVRVDYTPNLVTTGSGSADGYVPTLAGVGERVITDSDATPATVISLVSGTGERTVTGSGSADGILPTLAGVGERIITGSGSADGIVVTVAGSDGGAITGSGSADGIIATIAGVGERIVTGSGSADGLLPTLAGVGERTITGSGSADGISATISGSGSVPISGTGSADGIAPTISGSGARVIVVTGSASGIAPSFSGTGSIWKPFGSASVAIPTVSGTGEREITLGTDAVSVLAAIVSGQGSIIGDFKTYTGAKYVAMNDSITKSVKVQGL